MIIIERESQYADKLRYYKVTLDGETIGQIADGERKVFDVAKGPHMLSLRIDWARSNEVNFEMNGDEEVHFKCENRARGVRIILAIFYGTILSQRYIKLERVEKG